MTHYETLNIDTSADFKSIKKAYFKRAKECHPDRHGNSRLKEEEFKLVVAAFDVLSDPEKRYQYNCSMGLDTDKPESDEPTAASFSKHSIMDTPVDDTLEEMIVGNSPPKNATLATLMQDLQKTELFILYREGKTLYYNKKYKQAVNCFQQAVAYSPANILYRCYAARSLAFVGKYKQAIYHYQAALKIGSHRCPPQHLGQIRKELKAVKKRKNSFLFSLFNLFSPEEQDTFIVDADEKLIDQTNDAIDRILREKERKKPKQLK